MHTTNLPMAKQINRTECIIEGSAVSSFLESNYRPTVVLIAIGKPLSLERAANGLSWEHGASSGSQTKEMKSVESEKNLVIYQMCRAGYAPTGTPGPYDVRFELIEPRSPTDLYADPSPKLGAEDRGGQPPLQF
jgi:hypothetical protein